jgi:hypothetical protein
MAPEELLAKRIAKLQRVLDRAQNKQFKNMWASHLAHLKLLQKRKVN